MPDEQVATTESPTPPEAEATATETATPAPESTATEQQPAAPVVSDEEQRRAWLAELDPEEILRLNRRVGGKVGEVADKLARQREQEQRARWEAEAAERAREAEERQRRAELHRLAEQEIDSPLSQKVKESLTREEQREQAVRQAAEGRQREQQVAMAVRGEVDAAVAALWGELPEEDRQALAGKQYEGTWADGFKGFVKDLLSRQTQRMVDVAVKAELTKARAAWEKEVRPAIEKEVLAKINGAEQSPVLDGGAPSNGALTDAEFQQHRGDYAWMRANMSRINEALVAGRLRG